MRAKNRFLASFATGCALSVLLSACTPHHKTEEIEQLRSVEVVRGSAFTQEATYEYRDLADYELDQMIEYSDAIHFARKGLDTSEGYAVLPEPMGDWRIELAYVDELKESRQRLMKAFYRGARDKFPQLSAVAQVSYDCWIEDQEDMRSEPSNIGCRERFMDAMNRLEAALGPEPAVVTPPPPAEPAKVRGSLGNNSFMVLFDHDESYLTDAAKKILKDASAAIRSMNPDSVVLVGHTDRSGSVPYHETLSMERAQTVRDSLIGMGVRPDAISMEWRGELDTFIPTLDGIRERANRRVEIAF